MVNRTRVTGGADVGVRGPVFVAPTLGWRPDRVDVIVTVVVSLIGVVATAYAPKAGDTVARIQFGRITSGHLVAMLVLASFLGWQRRAVSRWRPTRGQWLAFFGVQVATGLATAVIQHLLWRVFPIPAADRFTFAMELFVDPIQSLLAGLVIDSFRVGLWRQDALRARAGFNARLTALADEQANLELRTFKANLNASAVASGLRTIAERLRADEGSREDAVALLTTLGDHLRRVVAASGRVDGVLEEEVESLAPLLELEQQARHRAFEWHVDLPDSEADRPVPRLLLGSLLGVLLEGRANRRVPARLALSVSPETAEAPAIIRMELADSGAGMRAESSAFVMLRQRLRSVFHDENCLVLDASGDAIVARVTLPRETEVRAEAGPSVPPVTVVAPKRIWRAWVWENFVGWRPVLLVAFMLLGGYKTVTNTLLMPSEYHATSYFHTLIRWPWFLAHVATVFWIVRRTPLFSLDGVVPGDVRRLAIRLVAVALGVGTVLVLSEAIGHVIAGMPRSAIPGMAEPLSAIAYHAFLRYALVTTIVWAVAAHMFEASAARIALWWHVRGFGRTVDQAERLNAEGELAALRAELNPHFLGNALHVVGSLVASDPRKAADLIGVLERVVARAARPLRSAVVRLADELADLRLYTAVAEARFGERLHIIADFATRLADAAVPVLLLQPLVENAIKHGLGPKGGAGTVTISAARVKRRLQLVVADDGVGPPAVPSGRIGVGMAHTQERLARLFGRRAACTLRARAGGGAEVIVAMPFVRLRPQT